MKNFPSKLDEKISDLEKSNAFLTSILNNTGSAIWTTDTNLNFVFFNSVLSGQYKSDYGVDLKPGINALGAFDNNLADFWKKKYKEALKGNPVNFNYSETTNVTESFYEVLLNPLFDNEDINGVLAVRKELNNNKANNSFASLFNNDDGIVAFSLDKNYRYTAFSQAHKNIMKTIWGVDIRIGMNILKLITNTADREKAKMNFDKTLKGEKFVVKEEYGDEGMSRIYWEDKYFPVINEKNEVTGLTVYVSNLTDVKRIESELLETEKLFRSVVDFTYEGVLFINKEGVITYANPNFATMLGYERDEIAGLNFVNFVGEESLELVKNRFKERIAGKMPESRYEVYVRKKNGESLLAEITVAVVKDNDNNPITVVHVMDISEMKKQMQELRKLSLVTEKSSNMIFIADREGVIQYVNPAYEKNTGFSKEEVVGKKAKILELNIISDELSKEILDTLLKGETWEGEILNKKKNGKPFWEKATVTPLFDDKRELVTFLHSSMDITKQKRDALIQKVLYNISINATDAKDIKELIDLIQSNLSLLIDTTNFFVALYDEETDTFTLPYFKDEYDNFVTMPAKNTITRHIVKTGKSLLADDVILKKMTDEGIIERHGRGALSWLGVPLKIGDNIIGAMAVQSYTDRNVYDEDDKKLLEIISSDISQVIIRKNTEDDLRAAFDEISKHEERYKGIINNTSNGIAVYKAVNNGEDFIFIEFNKAAEKIDKTSKEEVIGKKVSEVFPGVKEFGLFDVFKRVYKTGKPEMFPVSFYKDYRLEGYRENYIYKLSSGEVVAVYHDVTERKQFEEKLQLLNEELTAQNEEYHVLNEELSESLNRIQKLNKDFQEAKEKAEESNRLKTAFLHNISHEIRTPMNGIMGFSELLKQPDLSGEEIKEFVGIIQESSKRMLNTINDLVDISMIESGHEKVKVSEVNVNEELFLLYNFFMPEVEKKGMQLCLYAGLPDEESVIKTDKRKFNSIITNLIKNAIKYSNIGEIEFGYEKKGTMFEFYVKDTGIGIPKEKQEMIFERFVQADYGDTRAYEGSGLGLSISKSYVEMLGGKIWLESEESIGSKFYFTIPYEKEEKEQTADNTGVPENKEKKKPKKLKILIAEDDESSFMFLKIILKGVCDNILHAGTGKDAIEIFKQNPDIDLILMDIKMPVMDGYKATREIRKFNKDVPIIAQTAYAFSGDTSKALESGCNDYLSKPIQKNELYKVIDKYMKK